MKSAAEATKQASHNGQRGVPLSSRLTIVTELLLLLHKVAASDHANVGDLPQLFEKFDHLRSRLLQRSQGIQRRSRAMSRVEGKWAATLAEPLMSLETK